MSLYMTDIRYPTALAQIPATRAEMIFGMRADSFVRVAAPIITGTLSGVALVYSIQNRHQAALALALSGVIMSSILTAVQVYELEREHGGTA